MHYEINELIDAGLYCKLRILAWQVIAVDIFQQMVDNIGMWCYKLTGLFVTVYS